MQLEDKRSELDLRCKLSLLLVEMCMCQKLIGVHVNVLNVCMNRILYAFNICTVNK